MKKQFKQFIVNSTLEMRRNRGAKFMFYCATLELQIFYAVLANEVMGNHSRADTILISAVIQDLVRKKILHPDCIKYHFYSFESITYHDVFLKTTDNKIFSRGTSIDFSESYAKAIGEVFERTTIRFGDLNKVKYVKKSDSKKEKEYLDINLLPKPTFEQVNKYSNFLVTDEDVFAFVPSVKVSKGEEMYIPAQAVFLSNFTEKSEKILLQSTTHGAGAGFSSESAFRSGLYEIIHRHEFLKAWYFKKSPNIVNLETIPNGSELFGKVKNFENRGFKIFCADFSEAAGIPTFICILERMGAWYCGGSTSETSFNAINRAIDEAFSTYLWTQQKSLDGGNNLNLDYIKSMKPDFTDDSANDTNRVLLFGNSYFMKDSDKFFLSGKVVDFTDKFDKKDTFDLCIFANEKFGDSVFKYDFQSDVLNEYNYFVSKVYIPNSYYFALTEIYSRPVLSGIQPAFKRINPFP